MPRRVLALVLAALLPFAAACSDSDGSAPSGTGRPTTGEVSKALRENGGFTKAQADCVASGLDALSTKMLRAIVDKTTDDMPEADLTEAEAVLTSAFERCSIEAKPTTTTTP